MADRCTCANDGNASRCPHHTQTDFDSARATDTETLAEVREAHAAQSYEFETDQTYCPSSGVPTDACHTCMVLARLDRIVQARAGEGALRERVIAAACGCGGEAVRHTVGADRHCPVHGYGTHVEWRFIHAALTTADPS